jgi:hypothetical protein
MLNFERVLAPALSEKGTNHKDVLNFIKKHREEGTLFQGSLFSTVRVLLRQ